MGVEPRRCPWVDSGKPGYAQYHDEQWGVPVYDDRTMFEFLTLESAQAGLSWYTVLKKRDNYERAFAGFDVEKIARFNVRSVQRLMNDSGIIRNRLKIEAAINNARRFLEIQNEFGSFSDYLWRFVDGAPIVNRVRNISDFQATSTQSDAAAQDLKSRGFKFVGSTVMYAHMQATGLVNDHTLDCYRRQQIIDAYSG
ncbi:MAG TPA: DNA-3-methyladenine glycosylase I [Gammaproteobacteria bacterium]|nr:DNA-3-methyladenine glycosylase I [Gammaproteobacteria bacterium]